MDVEFSEWDSSDYLETEEDMAAYLNAVAELDDPALFQVALGDVAKARGMMEIAREAGVGRESLYKSLSAKGNPSFQTMRKVLDCLGLAIEVVPKSRAGELSQGA